VSPAELEWTRKTAGDCANNNHALVSGGARGVDQAAMLAALDAGGLSIGVLADGLSKAAIARVYRYALREQRLVLVSPYDPDARFMVGHAMERNKFIYALAHAGLVVQTDLDKGGTWAGAKEQLDRFRCGAVYVRADDRSPGAAGLRAKGAENWPDQPVDWQAVFTQQKPTQATAATVQEVEVSYGASLESDEKLLLRILEQPQGIRQIVSILNCPQSEVTPLLKKLENQEKIERNKRTKKYVVVSKTLF
jgi:predicted Rossmann fold nucleotide-binding protein DprA/Smf involved in DNA uptake